MQILATYQGQKHELPATGLADMVAFERQFGVSSSVLGEAAEGAQRLEYLCFLVYRGLRKLGVVTGPYDDAFLDGIEDISVEGADDEEGEADPTDPARATGS